jgi:predicted ATPase
MSKIKSLPDHTQHLLKLASCIGTHFNLATLATIRHTNFPNKHACIWLLLPVDSNNYMNSGLSPKEAARGLWKSLVAGLVIAAGENYFVMMVHSPHIFSSYLFV